MSRLGGAALLGATLIVAGALLGVPGLLLVGSLTFLAGWLTTLWSRRGLAQVDYARRLSTEHALWGDSIGLEVEVWNRKLLPLPLLRADDFVSDTLEIAGRPLQPSERPGQGSMQNSWSLLWYERVARRFRIVASRRGAFRFGPVRLTVSDLFERGVESEERELPAALLVRPRNLPVVSRSPANAPLGSARSHASLFHDPAQLAGVRPYRPGDPLRHVHWRATARVGSPVLKRFEPVHEREALLAVDLQTIEGPHWRLVYDDELVEQLCIATVSLARRILSGGAACGLLVGAQLSAGTPTIYLAPSTSRQQLTRIEDAVARLMPIVSLPFEVMLGTIPRRLVPGATVLAIGSRDPAGYVAALAGLRAAGYRVEHLCLGGRADEASARARLVGVRAGTLRLEPDWRTADVIAAAP